MIYYDNPLSGEELDVKNMAEAVYTLKLCNETHFSIFYQGQEMQRELARLDAEIYEQKYRLIEPYLPAQSDSSISKVIPSPLPAGVPASVVAAMNYLDEQRATFNAIFQADLAENTSELKESLEQLEEKVATWFKRNRNATWLAGGSIKLSGCTLSYVGGKVKFSYKDYDEED